MLDIIARSMERFGELILRASDIERKIKIQFRDAVVGKGRLFGRFIAKLIDELGIKCRIRSVPYPMLDIIARSMERFGDKTADNPAHPARE
jgi:hypothetical protein